MSIGKEDELTRLKNVQNRVRMLARRHHWIAEAIRSAFNKQLSLAARYLQECDAVHERKRQAARGVLLERRLVDPKIDDKSSCLVVTVEGLCPISLSLRLKEHSSEGTMHESLVHEAAAAALAALDRDRIYQARDRSESEGERMAAEYRDKISANTHVDFTWHIWVAWPADETVPAHPYDLHPVNLEQFSEADYLTIALYWLGGLADTGSARPIVPRPKGTGELGDVPIYAAWRGRFAIDDDDFDKDQPTLNVAKLLPDTAEEMLDHVEKWLSNEVVRRGERQVLTNPTVLLSSGNIQGAGSALLARNSDVPSDQPSGRRLTKKVLLEDIDFNCGADLFRKICRAAGINHGLRAGAAAQYDFRPHIQALIAVVRVGKWRCSQDLAKHWEKISAS